MLAKVLIDSLNERELGKGLHILRSNVKGLDKFEAFLSAKGYVRPKMMEFLRKLQALRTTSTAHRKGDNYDEIEEFSLFATKIFHKCSKTF
jgi:hypothetical protein